MDFCSLISHFIEQHALLNKGGRYLVALSGGPDSVALLRALLTLGYTVDAAHCNFHLRGAESDRDERFCDMLCQQLGVVLHRIHFDTHAYADLHQVSIEMAARELRYRYFEQLRQDLGFDGICVAHHQDDQAETILLNIVRGTGVRGLLGMQPRNGFILRPLLGVDRQAVIDYLHELQQEYVIDSTNLSDIAQRNILRLDVMPLLQRINPAVVHNLTRMAEHLSEANAFLDQTVADALSTMKNGEAYDLISLRQHPSAHFLLWQLLSPMGFNDAQVQEIIHSQRNGSVWTAKDTVATIDRGCLYLYNKTEWGRVLPEMRIPEEGTYIYNLASGSPNEGSQLKFRFKLTAVDEHFVVDKRPEVAFMDADKVVFPLLIRGLQNGDRFQPFGMPGTKLVSDYLTDRHRSLMDKRRQLVVTDATRRILWLVGERIDAQVAVSSRTTRVLTIMVCDSHHRCLH